MRRSSVKEYVEAIRGRYGRASRVEKGRMLEELTEVVARTEHQALSVTPTSEATIAVG